MKTRVVKLVGQLVLGDYNDEGELADERPGPEIVIYKPQFHRLAEAVHDAIPDGPPPRNPMVENAVVHLRMIAADLDEDGKGDLTTPKYCEALDEILERAGFAEDPFIPDALAQTGSVERPGQGAS